MASARIMIVEDTVSIRRSLETVLASAEDIELIGAHSSVEDARTPIIGLSPDVVIMDIGLPGKSGIEGIRELQPLSPATQFMIFTVHDDDERVFDALKAGASGYLLKNASPIELLEAVRELRSGGAPMSASVARRVVEFFRPRPLTSGTDALTDREGEVLRLLADGLLYKEIAARLGISISTVKQHIHHIYAKLHVDTRTEAVNRFFGR